MSNKTQRKTLERIIQSYEAAPVRHGNSIAEMIARTEYVLAKRMLADDEDSRMQAELRETAKCLHATGVMSDVDYPKGGGDAKANK